MNGEESELANQVPDPGMIANATGMRARDPWEMDRPARRRPEPTGEQHAIVALAEMHQKASGEIKRLSKGRMVQIADLIKELQAIEAKWGNTCVYIRDMSWGAVALNRQADDERSKTHCCGCDMPRAECVCNVT